MPEGARRNGLVTGVLLGIIYGIVSASMNQNPYYGPGGSLKVLEKDRHMAYQWQPSPVWLPSYLMCVAPINGWGIERTRSGYLFRTWGHLWLYFGLSMAVGAAIGAGIGFAVLRVRRAAK